MQVIMHLFKSKLLSNMINFYAPLYVLKTESRKLLKQATLAIC